MMININFMISKQQPWIWTRLGVHGISWISNTCKHLFNLQQYHLHPPSAAAWISIIVRVIIVCNLSWYRPWTTCWFFMELQFCRIDDDEAEDIALDPSIHGGHQEVNEIVHFQQQHHSNNINHFWDNFHAGDDQVPSGSFEASNSSTIMASSNLISTFPSSLWWVQFGALNDLFHHPFSSSYINIFLWTCWVLKMI